MIDIVNMSLDELYELADVLDDMRYLAKKYTPEWLDEAALEADAHAIDSQIAELELADEAAMNRAYEKEMLI